MDWLQRVAVVGCCLCLLGAAMPVVAPADEEYRYEVNPPGEAIAPPGEDTRSVPYRNLSAAEQRVFLRALAEGEAVHREDAVDGTHVTHFSDGFGYGRGLTLVRYYGRPFVLEGQELHENSATPVLGRFLVALGATVVLAAGVVLLVRLFRAEHDFG